MKNKTIIWFITLIALMGLVSADVVLSSQSSSSSSSSSILVSSSSSSSSLIVSSSSSSSTIYASTSSSALSSISSSSSQSSTIYASTSSSELSSSSAQSSSSSSTSKQSILTSSSVSSSSSKLSSSLASTSSSVISSSMSSSSVASSTSARSSYPTLANYLGVLTPGDTNGIVNGSEGSTGEFLTYGETYRWKVEASGGNLTNVTIGNLQVWLNGVSGSKGQGFWSMTATPENVGLFSQNCTYRTITVTGTNTNTSANGAYTNTTTQANLTVTPCWESGDVPSSMVLTSTTINLSYAGRGDYQTVIWMPTIAYNSTHKFCPYSCNNGKAYVNLSRVATASADKCIVTVNKSSEDGALTVCQQDLSLTETAGVGGVSYATTIVGIVVAIALGYGARLLSEKKSGK